VLSGVKYQARIPYGTATFSGGIYRCQRSITSGAILEGSNYFSDPGAGIDATASQQARSRLLGSYISAKNTWRGGNFLAEVGETIHMLAHPVQSIYKATWEFAGTVKRLGRVYRIKKQYGKHLADAWLAYVFGIRPFVEDANDAHAALKELAEGNKKDIMPLKGHGRNTVMVHNDNPGFTPYLFLGGTCAYRRIQKNTYDFRYRGAIAASLTGGTSIAEEFGVGIFDVVPAIWEAVPWSFLVDYFANIGEMIDSMRYAGASFNWLYSTVRNSGVVQYSDPIVTAPQITGGTASISSSTAWTLCVRVSRTPSSTMPYPPWRFKIPNIDSLKWLNVAALAAQVKGSKPLPFLG
jgi:hypothetical protein